MSSSRLTLSALSATVSVDFGPGIPPALVDRVREAWSGALAAPDTVPDRVLVYDQAPDADRFLEALSGAVTLEALEHERGRALLLHACGIAREDGRVLTFVGPSGRGKTTLSRTLGRVGGYVSDESIAIDGDLTVHPYRKPLSVVRPGMPKEQISPAAAGLRDLPDHELTLAAIVLIERDETLAAPVIEHLHFVDGVTALVGQASFLAELPGTVTALARLCDRIGGLRRVRYAEASDVVGVIEELLRPGPEPESWMARVVDIIDANGATAMADVVDYDHVMVVLSGRTLRILEGIAPAVLRAVSDGAYDLDEVVESVIAQVGPPPDGDAAQQISTVLTDLADAGFVVPRPRDQ